jgi:hypothetical protein
MSAKGGKIGGARRAASLTPERRKEIAQKAIAARWSKQDKRKCLKCALIANCNSVATVRPLVAGGFLISNELTNGSE